MTLEEFKLAVMENNTRYQETVDKINIFFEMNDNKNSPLYNDYKMLRYYIPYHEETNEDDRWFSFTILDKDNNLYYYQQETKIPYLTRELNRNTQRILSIDNIEETYNTVKALKGERKSLEERIEPIRKFYDMYRLPDRIAPSLADCELSSPIGRRLSDNQF